MSPPLRSCLRAALAVLCLGWTALFLGQKIVLTTADLGRHLKNGEITASLFTNSDHFQNAGVLSSNFYSFSHPSFPVLNHHWGSGLIFYKVEQLFGFEGLGFFQIALLLAAWGLMLLLAVRRGGWAWTAVWLLWLVPVFASRREIRPEIFSVFFISFYIFMFERYVDKKVSGRLLAWVLIVSQVLWTNLHIYYVFGPVICFLYGIHSLFDQKNFTAETRSLYWRVLVCLCASTAATPFGIRGVLYPFFIFGNYGYRLVENQSIPFLENLKVILPQFSFFKTASAALVCAVGLDSALNRRLPRPPALLALLLAVAGWRAIRNFQLFALVALPVLAAGFASVTSWKGNVLRVGRMLAVGLGVLIALFSSVWVYGRQLAQVQNGFQTGLAPGVLGSAEFFREEGLKGPVMNNYDIGGYLIYTLWPDERVFVDNRPEAYPASFFTETLVPAQENEEKWQQLDAQQHFNVIFFSYHDLTPWSQSFLIRRLDDPDWAPVYADSYAIIFLRRTVENSSVILRRELPRSQFRVISKA